MFFSKTPEPPSKTMPLTRGRGTSGSVEICVLMICVVPLLCTYTPYLRGVKGEAVVGERLERGYVSLEAAPDNFMKLKFEMLTFVHESISAPYRIL